jgi:hypothetical protein
VLQLRELLQPLCDSLFASNHLHDNESVEKKGLSYEKPVLNGLSRIRHHFSRIARAGDRRYRRSKDRREK